jgi:hypothetical protein
MWGNPDRPEAVGAPERSTSLPEWVRWALGLAARALEPLRQMRPVEATTLR